MNYKNELEVILDAQEPGTFLILAGSGKHSEGFTMIRLVKGWQVVEPDPVGIYWSSAVAAVLVVENRPWWFS